MKPTEEDLSTVDKRPPSTAEKDTVAKKIRREDDERPINGGSRRQGGMGARG